MTPAEAFERVRTRLMDVAGQLSHEDYQGLLVELRAEVDILLEAARHDPMPHGGPAVG